MRTKTVQVDDDGQLVAPTAEQFRNENALEKRVQNQTAGSGAPGVNDDSTQGYEFKSLWVDTSVSPPELYKCLDATEGAAVWVNTSLTLDELGSMALEESSSYLPAGGTAADVDPAGASIAAALAEKVDQSDYQDAVGIDAAAWSDELLTADVFTENSDSRLSDSREWTAATVDQPEAEAGTGTTRRAWTAQRVRQAISAWWATITDVVKTTDDQTMEGSLKIIEAALGVRIRGADTAGLLAVENADGSVKYGQWIVTPGGGVTMDYNASFGGAFSRFAIRSEPDGDGSKVEFTVEPDGTVRALKRFRTPIIRPESGDTLSLQSFGGAEHALLTATGLRVRPRVVSSSITAELDGVYHGVAAATYTDPTVPAEGRGFVVRVVNGAATVGGVAFSVEGTVISREYHSGAWRTRVLFGGADAAAVRGAIGAAAIAPITSQTITANTTISPTIDGATYRLTLEASPTITLDDFPSATQAATIKLIFIQDDTGDRVATFAGNVTFPGGVAPTFSASADAVDTKTFQWDGAGWQLVNSTFDQG
jgi:hypothetical protein